MTGPALRDRRVELSPDDIDFACNGCCDGVNARRHCPFFSPVTNILLDADTPSSRPVENEAPMWAARSTPSPTTSSPVSLVKTLLRLVRDGSPQNSSVRMLAWAPSTRERPEGDRPHL